jgi:single-strand DNA-binding protein
MNKAIIIGRLNKSGVNFNDNFDETPKCRFKLEVKERWQDNERAELVNIFAAGKDAQKMRTSRVGDLVFVKGLANNGRYEKEGETIYFYEVESKSLRIIKENGDLRQEGLYQNDITLIGHLGGDPKVFNDGKVTGFSIACNDYDGEKETTRWFNVSTFDGMAKAAAEYLSKGRLVSVEGKITTRTYEKDNEIKTATSIVANKWKALDSNPQKKKKEEYSESADNEFANDDIPL